MADDVTLSKSPASDEQHVTSPGATLTPFEHVFTTNPPIFNSLLSHLPTPAIFDLYHTNRFLRDFLRDYPLAWKILSFRLLPTANASNPSLTSGFESPAAQGESRKPYSQDLLLRSVIPYASCLTRLDLDNTAVSGTELYVRVLEPRRHSLQHLSIRGCKEVSLKYHILPYLQFQLALPPNDAPFALKSLYTYRCRHHRRRPYLPSSLTRRDSDSQPTHQLIDLCHKLGVWTDTAWCPTPGSRCYRRRDYYSSKLGAIREHEVWVPFDKLWRSQNIVGPSYVWSETPNQECPFQGTRSRRLWEHDHGWNGEPLGEQQEGVDGKEVPMHLRKSHQVFVEGHYCHKCKENIPERCEQCSVRMHCMGCRKTLCSSCAFDRPLRRKRRRSTHISNDASANETSSPSANTASFISLPPQTSSPKSRSRRQPYWWAPGATRSPNLMHEDPPADEVSSDEDDDGVVTNLVGTPQRPRLEMHWCCLRPCFSGGGGIGFTAPFCGGDIRAAPLPQAQGYEDPAFHILDGNASRGGSEALTDEFAPCYRFPYRMGQPQFDLLPFVEQPKQASPAPACPRSLCAPCYESSSWKIQCPACANPICVEHEVKTLKARKCGYRNLLAERAAVQQAKDLLSKGEAIPKSLAHTNKGYFHAKWLAIISRMNEADDVRRLNGQWAPDFTRRPLTLYSSFHTREPAHQPTMPGFIWDSSQAASGQTDQQPAFLGECRSQQPDFNGSDSRGTLSRSVSMSALQLQSTAASKGISPAQALQTSSWYTDWLAPLPIPWTGCGRLFCPPDRYPGDWRPNCLTDRGDGVQPCVICDINVCVDCRAENPCCKCTVCEARGYLCPNCMNRRDIQMECRRVEEETERVRKIEELEEAAVRYKRHVDEWWHLQQPERERHNDLLSNVADLFGRLEQSAEPET